MRVEVVAAPARGYGACHFAIVSLLKSQIMLRAMKYKFFI